MNKTLSQKEIDAILGRARAGLNEPDGGEDRAVQLCNFRSASEMSERYARFMTTVFEAFARSVSNSMGAYLRARFEMALASVEQMPVRDFLGDFQETGFVAVLMLQPGNTAALMQVDSLLVFPIIDVLLGGFGTTAPISREMTEIDEDIMEGVAQILCRQLEATWQPMGIEIRLERHQRATQLQNVFRPNEKLTSLTFEIKLNETLGAANLSFPTSFGSSLLREISASPRKKVMLRNEQRNVLRDRLLNCSFDSTMGVSNIRIPLRDLIGLRPGGVLDLRTSVENPASLIVGQREFFEAVPVRSRKQRAAQLIRYAKRHGQPTE
jgi:flagellar motor switch protein FliM